MTRFNDIWGEISLEMKRFNDLQEGRLKRAPRVQSKEALREVAVKPAPKKPKRVAPAQMNIADILFRSIISVSHKKPEFKSSEIIDRAMKSAGGSFKKESLRTALQGFKVGSKTANRQPIKCRDLIMLVEGKKGFYQLNPDKTPF